jgi:hypothetical protein
MGCTDGPGGTGGTEGIGGSDGMGGFIGSNWGWGRFCPGMVYPAPPFLQHPPEASFFSHPAIWTGF